MSGTVNSSFGHRVFRASDLPFVKIPHFRVSSSTALFREPPVTAIADLLPARQLASSLSQLGPLLVTRHVAASVELPTVWVLGNPLPDISALQPDLSQSKVYPSLSSPLQLNGPYHCGVSRLSATAASRSSTRSRPNKLALPGLYRETTDAVCCGHSTWITLFFSPFFPFVLDQGNPLSAASRHFRVTRRRTARPPRQSASGVNAIRQGRRLLCTTTALRLTTGSLRL